MKKTTIVTAALSFSLLLTACTKSTNDARDPYEKFNRTMFAFNQGFDKAVFRPAARVYMMALPAPVRRGLGNAYNNAAEVSVLPNDILQGKMHFFFHDLLRIFINTTFGIGGLFDVASKVGLKHHEQGYAATLAYYSPKGSQSPYLVLPFLGSWTFRSAAGLLMGYYSEPVSWIGSDAWRYSLVGGYLVSKRADFMDANQAIDEAFDPYVLVRNAFFQRHDRRMALLMSEKKPGDALPDDDHVTVDPEVEKVNKVMENRQSTKKTAKAETKPKPAASTAKTPPQKPKTTA
jgi:phospholipid-binding lipoprotein MlaA